MKQIFTFLTASFVLVLTLAGCASSKVQGHSVYCNIELNKVKAPHLSLNDFVYF